MESVTEILEHITKVCIRNPDGSLNLGSYEVELLEDALTYVKDTNLSIKNVKEMIALIIDTQFPYQKV